MSSRSQFLPGITYFNLSLPNNTVNNIPTIFQQDSTQTIVENTKTHNLAIVRFNFPTSLIPSHIIKIIPNPSDPNDMTYTPYNISMEIKNIPNSLQTENVTFIPEVSIDNTNPLYYYYYDPSQFVDIVNNTLVATYNDMLAIDNTLPSVQYAPFINYNYDNKLYELWVSYDCINRPNPLVIYFNDALSNYFPIPAFVNPLNPLLNSNLIIIDRHTNIKYLSSDVTFTNKYIVMSASSEVRRLASLQKILIVSNYGLQTQQEFVIAPNKILNQGNNSQAIISDFEVDFLQNNTQWLQYQAAGVGNYRLIEFTSNINIQNFQIQVYFQDIENNIYPLYIKPQTFASLKLALIPKPYFESLFT